MKWTRHLSTFVLTFALFSTFLMAQDGGKPPAKKAR